MDLESLEESEDLIALYSKAVQVVLEVGMVDPEAVAEVKEVVAEVVTETPLEVVVEILEIMEVHLLVSLY